MIFLPGFYSKRSHVATSRLARECGLCENHLFLFGFYRKRSRVGTSRLASDCGLCPNHLPLWLLLHLQKDKNSAKEAGLGNFLSCQRLWTWSKSPSSLASAAPTERQEELLANQVTLWNFLSCQQLWTWCKFLRFAFAPGETRRTLASLYLSGTASPL